MKNISIDAVFPAGLHSREYNHKNKAPLVTYLMNVVVTMFKDVSPGGHYLVRPTMHVTYPAAVHGSCDFENRARPQHRHFAPDDRQFARTPPRTPSAPPPLHLPLQLAIRPLTSHVLCARRFAGLSPGPPGSRQPSQPPCVDRTARLFRVGSAVQRLTRRGDF